MRALSGNGTVTVLPLPFTVDGDRYSARQRTETEDRGLHIFLYAGSVGTLVLVWERDIKGARRKQNYSYTAERASFCVKQIHCGPQAAGKTTFICLSIKLNITTSLLQHWEHYYNIISTWWHNHVEATGATQGCLCLHILVAGSIAFVSVRHHDSLSEAEVENWAVATPTHAILL